MKRSLNPDMIVQFIRENPGCIQNSTYPNPGEPKIDESIFLDPNGWEYLCWSENMYVPTPCDPMCADCVKETYDLWGFEGSEYFDILNVHFDEDVLKIIFEAD